MSDIYVRIFHGERKGYVVNDEVFELITPWRRTKRAGNTIISVRADGRLGETQPKEARVKVAAGQYQYEDADGNVLDNETIEQGGGRAAGGSTVDAEEVRTQLAIKEYFENETDDEAIERIRNKFDIYDMMVQDAIGGDIKGLVVSGPPGVGKSYKVHKMAEEAKLATRLGAEDDSIELISGAARPIGLYKKLFNHRHRGHVVVLDDCDSLFNYEDGINVLKAALDTTGTRTVSWLSETNLLRAEEIPDHFEFKGSIIFLTNQDFSDAGRKLQPHLDAIKSRCHYLDLEIGSTRDRMLRIEQIVGDGMLDDYGFGDKGKNDVLRFVRKHKDNLDELSLRTVAKLADLRKKRPQHWQAVATETMMSRGTRLRMLVGQ